MNTMQMAMDQETAEDFEAYVTCLPRAEDFWLEGFQEVPLEVLDEADGGIGIWDLTICPDMMPIVVASTMPPKQQPGVELIDNAGL